MEMNFVRSKVLNSNFKLEVLPPDVWERQQWEHHKETTNLNMFSSESLQKITHKYQPFQRLLKEITQASVSNNTSNLSKSRQGWKQLANT